MNTTDLTPISVQERIETLTKTKYEFNMRKLAKLGSYDNDDHGWIPWDEPVNYEKIPNHADGGVYGARALGENFRAWLDAHPVYIHPYSALGGAWVGMFPGLSGWKPEDRPTHLHERQKKYNIRMPGIGAMNHLAPDMKIGLELGWGGILKKIRAYRKLNRPLDTGFYDGEEQVVLGIQDWITRHVSKARKMAAEENNEFLRQNLLEIADTCEWLVENPPRTLREAVQFLSWFQSVDRMYACGGGLCQLDESLRPYYEADKAAGILTDDEDVIWYIASLLFNDTHYSQIGGPAPDGHDLTSRMSFLILEAAHRLKIPFNLALRVHPGLDQDLFRRSVELLLRDRTGVSFSLSKGLDEGYARNGVPIQLARMRAKVGCNWTALPGIEYSLQDVTRHCLTTPFLLAFYEIADDPAAASRNAANSPCASSIERVKRSKSMPVRASTSSSVSCNFVWITAPVTASEISCFCACNSPPRLWRERCWLQWTRYAPDADAKVTSAKQSPAWRDMISLLLLVIRPRRGVWP